MEAIRAVINVTGLRGDVNLREYLVLEDIDREYIGFL